MRPTLRNNIVTSTLTLPVVSLLCAVLWMLPDVRNLQLWGGLAAAALLVYIVMETINRNQLLRIRSRMISVTLVAWLAASSFLHPIGLHYVPALVVAASLYLLFPTHQAERSERAVFHVFLLTTIGGFAFPPLLVLLPVYLFSLAVQLRALTWRALGAALLGVLLPLWLGFAYLFLTDQLPLVQAWAAPWIGVQLPDYKSLTLSYYLNVGFALWQFLLGLLHYYRTNFNDKIHVRICFYVTILLEVAFLTGTLLLPQHFLTFQLLLILGASPLVGHYYALARGRFWMTLWFLLNVLALAGLGAWNHFVG